MKKLQTIGEYNAEISEYLKGDIINEQLERRMFMDDTRGKFEFVAQRDSGEYYDQKLESLWVGWIARAKYRVNT